MILWSLIYGTVQVTRIRKHQQGAAEGILETEMPLNPILSLNFLEGDFFFLSGNETFNSLFKSLWKASVDTISLSHIDLLGLTTACN